MTAEMNMPAITARSVSSRTWAGRLTMGRAVIGAPKAASVEPALTGSSLLLRRRRLGGRRGLGGDERPDDPVQRSDGQEERAQAEEGSAGRRDRRALDDRRE